LLSGQQNSCPMLFTKEAKALYATTKTLSTIYGFKEIVQTHLVFTPPPRSSWFLVAGAILAPSVFRAVGANSTE
jgi:hypothetical protein